MSYQATPESWRLYLALSLLPLALALDIADGRIAQTPYSGRNWIRWRISQASGSPP
jgi:hypothetical protein